MALEFPSRFLRKRRPPSETVAAAGLIGPPRRARKGGGVKSPASFCRWGQGLDKTGRIFQRTGLDSGNLANYDLAPS
jgi:hypothetical protein